MAHYAYFKSNEYLRLIRDMMCKNGVALVGNMSVCLVAGRVVTGGVDL